MKKLFVYLKEYKKESVLGPLFKLLEACFELFVPLVVASMIDRGIAEGDVKQVVLMCLVLVGLGLVGLACSVTAQYFAAKASVGFVKKLRHALFAHIQGFSYSTLDSVGSATLITRLTNDTEQVQTGLNLALRLLLRSPFVVFGAAIMAFTVDTRSALWFLAAIPALALVVFGIMLICMPLYKRVQERLDGVLGATRENLTGVRVLRAFGREESEIEAFDAKNAALAAMQKRVGRIAALMNPLTFVLINIAAILLIRTGAVRVEAGLLTRGAVVALYNYMGQILVELIKLADLIINITKSLACAKRVAAVLEIPSGESAEETGVTGDPRFRVEFRNAAAAYPGAASEALSGVTLRAKPGEVIGIIGGTGSGKTTLVNLIPRFYDASEGSVLVDGRDVRSYDPKELRRKIGVVPQKAALFKGTIRENLLWGCETACDEELMRAVRLAQAEDIVEKKGGLDGIIEQGGRNLSGGQKQRLTIARALVGSPEILILDDSSSALDTVTDAALRRALQSLDNAPTVFIVSQRTGSIRRADMIAVLEEGRVAGMGSHDELLENCPVYKEIYDSQYAGGEVSAV
ncbi:MAG: ABC transporter ATP-binding protein [Clostridia bacterium]|nr:ABC transporter ATP-binding protein [Clostridia bacterium]MBR3486824.1 ABC transporter ATP-binding protein [Clostridia bacterium]